MALPRPRSDPVTAPRRTHVAVLDHALPHGVRPGSTLLAVGDPACGMEVLAKEFAAREAPTLYYAPDESADEVEAGVRRFDGDASPIIVDLASLYYDHVVRSERRGPAPMVVAPRDPRPQARRREFPGPDLPDLLREILEEVRTTAPRRTVIDTLDFFFETHDAEDVVRTFRALRLANRDVGGLLLVTKVRSTVDPRIDARLEHIADVVLDLHAERAAIEDNWELRVKKVRNRPQDIGRFRYRPHRDGGLVVDRRHRI